MKITTASFAMVLSLHRPGNSNTRVESAAAISKIFRGDVENIGLERLRSGNRPTRLAVDAVLANTTLSRTARQAVCDAFADAGLISGSKLRAAGTFDSQGRYSLRAVDAAIAQFPSHGD